ncbi:MAG: PEP-utilizing enzyme [Patescibacteria group bacterium]
MINADKKLFFWGPIDGRLIYATYFMLQINDNSLTPYNYRWPEFVFEFKNDKMTFVCEDGKLRRVGVKVFNDWFLKTGKYSQLKKALKSRTNALLGCQQKLNRKKISDLTDEELITSFNNWQRHYLSFWEVWLIPEMANWGGEYLLAKQLKEKKLDQQNYLRAMEILAAPVKLSFFQEEELSLLKVAKLYGKSKYAKELEKHTINYYWLLNSYYQTKVLTASYFNQKILDKIRTKVDLSKEIKAVNSHSRITKQAKGRLVGELKLSRGTVAIADQLAESIYLQDARKALIWQVDAVLENYLKEFGRRLKTPFANLKYLWPDEIVSSFAKKKVPRQLIIKRQRLYIAWMGRGFFRRQSSSRALKLMKKINNRFENKQLVRVLKGLLVSQGTGSVSGSVRLITTAKDLSKMKKGEILVTTMTAPEYITAMRRAKAIITDVGGITSHAAIVSRELKIPCIVGTGLATKILKNGQTIMVDVKKGMVSGISNA